MFIVAVVPALFVVALASTLPESPVWQQQHLKKQPGLTAVVRANWKLFLYAMILMFAAAVMSHGTQDLYPSCSGSNISCLSPGSDNLDHLQHWWVARLSVRGHALPENRRRWQLVLASAAMLVLMRSGALLRCCRRHGNGILHAVLGAMQFRRHAGTS